MTKLNVSVLTAAAALLVACGGAPKTDFVAEEKAIRDISMHWLDLAKAKDAAGEAAVFAADGIAYRIHHEPAIGPAAIQAFVAKDDADNPKGVPSWATTSVTIATSGDLAVETGTYHFAGGGAKGDGDDKGNFVTVYKKVNGVWKVAEDISTSSMPEAVPAKPAAPPKAASKKAPTKTPAKTSSKAPAKAPVKKK